MIGLMTYWHQDEHSAQPDPPCLPAWIQTGVKFTVFGDEDVEPLLDEFRPGSARLYRSITIPSCKSDIARYALLLFHGGLYVDSHTGPGCLKSIDVALTRLTRYEAVLFDWVERGVQLSQPGKPWREVVNAPIGGVRGSRTLEMVLNMALDSLLAHYAAEKAEAQYVEYDIWKMTSTGVWYTVVLDDVFQLREEYLERVSIFPLLGQPDDVCPVFMNQYANYNSGAGHWFSRQKTTRLFRP